MAVLWLFEHPRKKGDVFLSHCLMGEFAVRCFASLDAFFYLARSSAIKPHLVLIDRQDFAHHETLMIYREFAKIFLYPLVVEAFPSGMLTDDSPQNNPSQQMARLCYHDPIEMLFLLKQLYRRFSGNGNHDYLKMNQDFSFDVHAHKIFDHDRNLQIELSPKEGRILKLLLSRADTGVARRDIEQAVWADCRVSKRTVDSHMSRLRKKLEPVGFNICSLYGKGYRLESLQ